MPYIPKKERALLEQRFDLELQDDVTIQLFTTGRHGLFVPGREECVTCPAAEDLLGEVTQLSPNLVLAKHDIYSEPEVAAAAGVDKVPALVIRGADSLSQGQVRFFGLPSGYEFKTLVDGIVAVSRGVSPLSSTTHKELEKAFADNDERLHIQVFVTPT